MTSVEKVHRALEELADMDDTDFEEALPVPLPPSMARGFLPLIARSIPENPGELDAFLTQVGDFCHHLRSDRDAAAA